MSSNTQSGVLAPIPAVARYLTFGLIAGDQARAVLRALRPNVDGSRCVLGLSESLVEGLDANVPGLKAFPALVGAGIEIPATAGALWCWLRGNDRGELLHATRNICATVAAAFELVQIVDAFKHGSGRDLTGYEDGTENPQGEAAIAAAVVSDRGAGLNGSSFVAVQQWLHDFRRFEAMTADEQDNSIGRRKSDNEELEEAPESAHVKRTAQESFSPEAFLVRRSMPWASELHHGLMFVAFGHSFDAFEAQLKRMTGLEDGVSDALFKFTRPITGNYFWCPPLRDGRLDLSALGL
jgi:putative iron-dependent peroxidase